MVNNFGYEKCYFLLDCHARLLRARNDYDLKVTRYEQKDSFDKSLDSRFRGV